jgi:hypothetical protein
MKDAKEAQGNASINPLMVSEEKTKKVKDLYYQCLSLHLHVSRSANVQKTA